MKGTVSRILALLVGATFASVSCEDRPGRAAYVDSGCPRCHAADLTGTRLGPPLTWVSFHWNESELRLFLTKPDSFRVHDERLRLVAEQYPAPMPIFVMTDSVRAHLVGYLLTLTE